MFSVDVAENMIRTAMMMKKNGDLRPKGPSCFAISPLLKRGASMRATTELICPATQPTYKRS